MHSFIGGIHPEYNKITRKSRIKVAPLPKKVILPLQQHTGAPCNAIVNSGNMVKVGQKIADSDKFVFSLNHITQPNIIIKK